MPLAIELRRRGDRAVEVLERETQAGGVPRHCQHLGFGMRDLHRVMSGPAYAEHYARAAANAGVRLRLATTATEWTGPRTLSLTSRAGVEEVSGRAVILATGARERPRSARLVAGTRPSGVYTTGQLQQLVYLQGRRLEGRCVIVGAEHVSYSAALTARHAGATVVAMLSELDAHQTYAAFARAASWRFRFPLLTETTVERIVGQGALRGVEVRDRAGRSRTIDADFVVFTGDWIPDHELARRGGLTLHPATKGPIVDTSLATSATGVFAAGNLIHPVETADVVALDGRHVAASVHDYLRGRATATGAVAIETLAPLAWIVPSEVCVGTASPRERFVLRASERLTSPTFVVRQGGRTLARQRRRGGVGPNRSITITGSWTNSIDPSGPEVVVSVE